MGPPSVPTTLHITGMTTVPDAERVTRRPPEGGPVQSIFILRDRPGVGDRG